MSRYVRELWVIEAVAFVATLVSCLLVDTNSRIAELSERASMGVFAVEIFVGVLAAVLLILFYAAMCYPLIA